MIPTETFDQIAQQLDKADLMNLCYVSPFYQDQANRILYRSVFTGRSAIQGQEYIRISQFIRTIRAAPRLALHVQELKFVAPSKVELLQVSQGGPKRRASFFSAWSTQGAEIRPFSSLVNVRKLTVESFDLHVPWPKYLNSLPPGRLEELSTQFTVDSSFLEFLALHPTITAIGFPFINEVDVPDVPSIPTTIASSMTHLTAGSLLLPLIVSWGNLTHLQLGCGPVKETAPLISALYTIGPQLVNLMISSHDGGQWNKNDMIPLADIAQRTPNLRVFSLRMYFMNDNKLGVAPFNLTKAHWRKLDTLIFIHPRAPKDPGDGLQIFPSLERLLCIDFFGFDKTVTCFRLLSVTKEVEVFEPPSDVELDELCFSLFSLSREP